MRIIESDEVRARLTPDVTIALMREALTKLESGEAVQPLRSVNALPGGDSFGFMPRVDKGLLRRRRSSPRSTATWARKYPSHMGYVMLFESVHGAPVGMADASAITELRTGAVSAVATDLLARKGAKTLAIIGCGAQGRSHLAAISRVRKLESVKCYDINAEAARRYAAEQGEKYGIPVTVADSVEEAVRGADIVCTLTPSKEPYLKAEWIAPGTHVNAVGTFTPVTREATSELVAKSRLYADQVEAMKRESGEYLIPLKEGLITEAHIVGSIGAALLGKVPGRRADEEITLFDALGLAIEDVICAKYLLRLKTLPKGYPPTTSMSASRAFCPRACSSRCQTSVVPSNSFPAACRRKRVSDTSARTGIRNITLQSARRPEIPQDFRRTQSPPPRPKDAKRILDATRISGARSASSKDFPMR